MRDPDQVGFALAAAVIITRPCPFGIDVLHGDGEGCQRVITRFALRPRDDGS